MNPEIEKHLHSQEIIDVKNKYFSHLLKHQKKYLVILMIIIFFVPLINNSIDGKPTIIGEESYYHLSQAKEVSFENFYYLPLNLLTKVLPFNLYFIIPFIITFLSIIIATKVTERVNIDKEFRFFLLALLIISPTFIFSSITISGYIVYFFMVMVSFLLLTQKSKVWNYLAIVPLLAATYVDVLSSMFLMLLLLIYVLAGQNKKKKPIIKISFFAIPGLTLINWLFFKTPLVLGPFRNQFIISDLISDLGGLSGINLFTLLLALMGLAITWKKKNYYFAYLFLPFAIAAYFFNTAAVFHLSLITTFFATSGIVNIFKRKWNLAPLKKITFFILILGLMFSTLTYLDRIDNYDPKSEVVESLTWMKNNVAENEVVYSITENSYYIKYFSELEPFYQPHQQNQLNEDENNKIAKAISIDELFPILENNGISIIYFTADMKKEFLEKQQLLFLLKNERFKLVHSHEGSEVWQFKKDDS